MRLLRILGLTLALLFPVGLGVSTVGCGDRPVTIETPAGQAAYAGNQVLIRVEELQDAVLAAQKNGALTLDTARAIVYATTNVAELSEAATQGWKPTALAAWAQAKKEIPALQQGGQFALLAAAIDQALGGAQ